jgi:hypothetical protein
MTPKRPPRPNRPADPKGTPPREGDDSVPKRDERDTVEEASEDSFPASDPPASQPLHPGKPGPHPDRKRR